MNEVRKSPELELKLRLPGPEAEMSIVKHLTGRGYRLKEAKRVRNEDIYLDTFDWDLLKKGLSLRYRTKDGAAFYTLKGLGRIEEGIAERMEIEAALEAPVIRPAEVRVKEINGQIDRIIHPWKLLEQILVRTDRHTWRLTSPAGARMEMSFDEASFQAKGLNKSRRTRNLRELEAELLQGAPEELIVLREVISQLSPYPPSAASKLQTAMERLSIRLPSKRPPAQYLVRLTDRLDQALRKILSHQFLRFGDLLPGVIGDTDPEFVHQARVATRRMRSALVIFSGAVSPARFSYLASELKWLADLFGAVRDLDVFLLNLNVFEEKIERFFEKKIRLFTDLIESRRTEPLKELKEGLSSPRYEKFEKALTRFLQGPLPSRPRGPLASKSLREAAPLILKEKLDGVIGEGQRAQADPKPKRFHRLRIEMKRLRYACEFVAPAYDGALERFIETTVEIQDCLGELQDTVFTKGFIDDLYGDWKGKPVHPDLIFLLGEIYQLQGAIARERQRSFGRLWGPFAGEEALGELRKIPNFPKQAESVSGRKPPAG